MKDIFNFTFWFSFNKTPVLTLVVLIKDREHDVEDLIRFLISKTDSFSEAEDHLDILIIDYNSTDITFSILTRLIQITIFLKG